MRFNRQEAKDIQGAQCIGWTSLAIGLTELAAPRQVQKLLGLEESDEQCEVLRVLGIREVLHGVSLVAQEPTKQQLAAGLWGRVAGDVLDNALLGVAATKTKKPGSFAMVAASVAVIGALDFIYARKLSQRAQATTAWATDRLREVFS